MAVRLSHSLARQNLIDFLPLSEDFYVAELLPPKEYFNKYLKELGLRSKYHVQVVAVKNRKTGEFYFAPGGEYKILETDVLIVLGKEEDIIKIKG